MASKSSAPLAWTVGDLGAFYTQHRAELHAHASRLLKDQIKAEEITQDALIKLMLAAPELESEEHALSYLAARKRPERLSCSAWYRPQHAQTLNTHFTLAYPIDYIPDSGRLVFRCHSAKALLSIPPPSHIHAQPTATQETFYKKFPKGHNIWPTAVSY